MAFRGRLVVEFLLNSSADTSLHLSSSGSVANGLRGVRCEMR